MQPLATHNAASPQHPASSTPSLDRIIADLERLHLSRDHPARFWPAFLETASRLAGAAKGFLLSRSAGAGKWKILTAWPTIRDDSSHTASMTPLLEKAADEAEAAGWAWDFLDTADDGSMDRFAVLAVRLVHEEKDRLIAAIFLLRDVSGPAVEEIAIRLRLIADTPMICQRMREARRAGEDAARFADALDLMVLLHAEKKFAPAAMTFCNESACRHRCSRVSLGWIDGGYVRLRAVSHMARFEGKMDMVGRLESAMEEAFDQDEEILWPPPSDHTAVTRDHEIFAREAGAKSLVSLPIRLDGEPVAILTCEREAEPFTEMDVLGLRVLCDQAGPRLRDLKERDGWIGKRTAAAVRAGLSRLVGVEHTLAKAAGILACGLLFFLLFAKLPYRIEASFILKSDEVRHLSAPFDGYIDEVHVKAGEEVREGDLLASLDTRDLLMEESSAIANQARYLREAEKARAENGLAEMKIAQALADQARAQLDGVRYRLGRAEVRAPIAGVVVEGDFEELPGAAVSKGDVLFKLARIDRMHVELDVSERDIHELIVGATGEMAFVSQPRLKFPITVGGIEPIALANREGNVFHVLCPITGQAEPWWRPGMSGVAKIDAGKRRALWIVTHRTVDFFRMLLWY